MLFPRAGAQTQNDGPVIWAGGKIHQKSPAWGTQCALEQLQLGPAQTRGTPPAPASSATVPRLHLFVHPRCNYQDLLGNLLSSPCLLSTCSEFKADSTRSLSRIGRSITKSAAKFAELQRGRRAHFSQLMKSLESICIKSIEGKPQDRWQKGTRGCYGEKSSLKAHRTLGERPSGGTMNYEKLSTTPTNEMATAL